MKEKEFSVKKFLEDNKISLNGYDHREDIRVYLDEMQMGLDSESSIPMLPTYIEERESLPQNEPVLVLDAGGTNFRAAIVTFSGDNDVQIDRFRKRGMPGFEREHSRQEFFDALADFVADLAGEVSKIGFCFSYPMTKTADKDGRLIGFSKEIKAEEVVGEMIGAGVLEALERKGITNIEKIVLLNDTIATLLAGKVAGDTDSYDTYIGWIYGTGVNACYNEHNDKIGKVEGLPSEGSQLINMESGSCSIMAGGDIDLKFRNTTAKPLNYVFEKMVSGGYLGSLWFFTLKTAAAEGCFSETFCSALDKVYDSGEAAGYDASDLSLFLSDKKLPEGLDGCANAEDLERAMEISSAITKRAAYLTAVMVTSIMIKTGKGKTSAKPVCLCADGTTFWKLHGLKKMVTDFIDSFTSEAGIHYKIIQIENAPIIGAAVAGLTNS